MFYNAEEGGFSACPEALKPNYLGILEYGHGRRFKTEPNGITKS